jgi:hypothetical protein
MHPDVRTALLLQELDLRITELKREIAALPRQIAEIERLLESHIKRLDLDKTALAANQRERKKLEGDISTHQQKISRLRDQMLLAKTNEQYRAFLHEIAFEESAISKGEDRILEQMIEAEALEKNVKAAEVSLNEERRVVEAKKRETKQRTDEDRAALAEAEARRNEAAATLPPSFLATYDRLRQRNKDGVAISEAKGGICLACRLTIRPQLFEDLKKSDAVVTCENCRRILYFEVVTDVEGTMNV